MFSPAQRLAQPLFNLFESTQAKAYLALFIVYIVWGTTFGAIRIGIHTFPAEVFAACRFLSAGIILLTCCLINREKMPTWAAFRRHALVALFSLLLGNSLVYWAIQNIPSGMGTTLTATTPFWMVGISAALPPKEKIPSLAWVGLVIGFMGIPMLILPELMKPMDIAPSFWVSVITMLFLAGSWGVGSIIARRVPTQDSLFMSVGMQNLVAGSILATISLFVTDFSNIHPTSDSIWALGYLILFGTILSLTCYMYMLEHLPVSVSSTFSYVTPVVATIFGALVLHEPVTWNIVVGIATILLGVFLVQLGNQQKVSQKKISPQTQPVVSTNARRSSSDTTPESQPKTASV